ncbi:MAG: element excision factor XisI family protein [Jaaginema sp. PMC 1079.18]|nr:element excision factor XisI family protein [Jaaginema sp. PMC 1080.18]MEC4852338.1 element excision factor XisI family protein [Jaaginema sp. PMC 1079.18]MEC4868950.1 element excision factor XisI family protein [Jaaginema sp. PMC 1078.18]
MDNSLNYQKIIQETLQKATQDQPRLQALRLYPVCDLESGHFLVLATGWDKQRWLDIILFHARLADNKVFIAEDNFEEGLTNNLIAAGIKAEDIVSEARSLYSNAS